MSAEGSVHGRSYRTTAAPSSLPSRPHLSQVIQKAFLDCPLALQTPGTQSVRPPVQRVRWEPLEPLEPAPPAYLAQEVLAGAPACRALHPEAPP